MNENFLMRKEVDKSMLERGFAIPVSAQENFSLNLSGGRLAHGEKRDINIFLDGEFFTVKLSSSGFNREKYSAHSDQWQVLYPKTSPFANKIRKIFSAGKSLFTLYPTDLKDTFHLVARISCEETILEKLLELPTLTDSQAALVEKFGLTKRRKLNRNLIDQLKLNYDYRCQICGRNIGELYGVSSENLAMLLDCHHIEPFSISLNNDETNLIIVCPNHHRIIHTAEPTFDRERKLYLYPNGYQEILQLNEHL